MKNIENAKKNEEVEPILEVEREVLIAKIYEDMNGYSQIDDTIKKVPLFSKEIKTLDTGNEVNLFMGANWYKVFDKKLHDIVHEFGDHFKLV